MFHHLYVGDWTKAYPKASVSACSGLEKKRPEISWSRVLGGEAPADVELGADLEQLFFSALPMQNEVVFFDSNPERIVLAHGDVVPSNGAAVLQNGYRWLDPK